MTTTESSPVAVTVHNDGTGEVRFHHGEPRRVGAADIATARTAIIEMITEEARRLQHPLRAQTTSPSGSWTIQVHPDGTVTPDTEQPQRQPAPEATSAQSSIGSHSTETLRALQADRDEVNREQSSPDRSWTAVSETDSPQRPATWPSEQHPPAQSSQPTPANPVRVNGHQQAPRPASVWGRPEQQPPTEPEQQPEPRRAVSFLDEGHAEEDETPAAPPSKWWQRLLGITPPGPTPEELAEQRDIQTVSQPWLGPRSVAVVNGKGGSGKTPATALLAAIFARSGGGGVLAWDNNETRGSLGWRTEKSPHHDATVQDLIPATQDLMDARAALSKISAFVHHQPADKFDVLRSNPELLAAEQRLTSQQFRAVHEVTQRYFRLTILDSGNDESSYNYLNMLDVADQLLVPTSTAPDRTESARLLLAALWARGDKHSRSLAENAVVIVSQADREEENAEVIADLFRGLTGKEDAVVTVPYDPALRQMQLRYDQLAPATQRAYLRAAAEIAHQLNHLGSS